MRVYIATFGCKVNQYESDAIITNCAASGFEIAHSWENADAIVVNSCVVTDRAEQKSASFLRRVARDNPHAKILLTGCMAEKQHDDIGQIDIKNNDKVNDVLRVLGIQGTVSDAHVHDRTRTYIKIQDGCNAWCAYCIIPHVRGRERDENFDTIIRQAHSAVDAGFKEIVLTGIHTGRYARLIELLDAISEIDGLERVRISSIELNEVTDALAMRMAKSNKLVPHLHIPLQSGNDRILSLMKRPYTRDQFVTRVNELIHLIPTLGVTTDLIVGFPTETEDDFLQSLSVIHEAHIHRVHVFPYSRRDGTVAATMEGHLSSVVKKERAERARNAAQESFAQYVQVNKGTRYKLLVEEINKNGIVSGYTENYLYVECEYPEARVNDVVEVILDEPTKGDYCATAHKA